MAVLRSVSAAALAAGALAQSTLVWQQSESSAVCALRRACARAYPARPLTTRAARGARLSSYRHPTSDTSAGLARHAGTTPTFATATWLNTPIMVRHRAARCGAAPPPPRSPSPRRSGGGVQRVGVWRKHVAVCVVALAVAHAKLNAPWACAAPPL